MMRRISASLPPAAVEMRCISFSSIRSRASMGTMETSRRLGVGIGMSRPGAFHSRRSAAGR
jgi:hypothetical protein